jgi:hypothetical protein
MNFLEKVLKDGMAQKKITVQKYRLFPFVFFRPALTFHETETLRYWINNIVDNDCHRFLQHIDELLHMVASAMLESGEDTHQLRQECEDFVDRHVALAKPLAVALELIRRGESADATDQGLKTVCAQLVRHGNQLS